MIKLYITRCGNRDINGKIFIHHLQIYTKNKFCLPNHGLRFVRGVKHQFAWVDYKEDVKLPDNIALELIPLFRDGYDSFDITNRKDSITNDEIIKEMLTYSIKLKKSI